MRHGCSNYQGAKTVSKVPQWSNTFGKVMVPNLMHWTFAMCFSHAVLPVVSRIDALSNLRAAAFWTMHWLQSSWLLNTDVEKDRASRLEFVMAHCWLFQWHVFVCCRCSMHVLWPPKQSKWRTQVAFSPKMKGATETTRVWPFLHRFFAKICQEKKTQSDLLQ